jgi:hypothetical protein
MSHGGVRAVGGEHVAGANAGLDATFAVEQHGRDAVGLVGQLDPEPRLRVRSGEQGGSNRSCEVNAPISPPRR